MHIYILCKCNIMYTLLYLIFSLNNVFVKIIYSVCAAVAHLFSKINRFPWDEYTRTRHLDSFYSGTVMNNAVINILVPVC